MLGYIMAVIGLSLACGAWVLFQRWVQKADPGQPGVERSKGCGGCGSCKKNQPSSHL